MRENQFSVEMDDGFLLHTYQWLPEDEKSIRGVVQVVHGMAEHAERYRYLGEKFAANNFACIATDHRGHGKSANGHLKGHFADSNGWQRCLADLASIHQKARALAPKNSQFIIGHSMGSFLTQHLLINQQISVNGAILTGSNCDRPAIFKAGELLADLEIYRSGKRHKSKILDFLSFSRFNSRFKPNRTSFDWLSRDTAIVDQYVADPNCGFLCTNQFWKDMLHGLAYIFTAENQRKIAKDTRIIIVGGELDPISYPNGLMRLKQALAKAGIISDLRIYPGGRHEILNELNRDEVIAMICDWIKDIAQ